MLTAAQEVDGPPSWVAERRPWPDTLDGETSQSYFRDLMHFVDRERTKHDVFPDQKDVFAAFDLTPPEKVKVVIIGQDPYFQPGHANGLCFSVPRGVRLPASLRNIYAAMRHDGITPPQHGDLHAWAREGVLLLNTALTVRSGAANSHSKEWRTFTDAVIRHLDTSHEALVFVLWGRAAQRKKQLIDSGRHAVIEAPHPAARGEFGTEFKESRPFTTINAALSGRGQRPVDWRLPD